MSQALAQQLATAIDADLRAAGNSVRAASEKQYLRSDLRFYGAGIPAIRRIVTTARRAHPNLDRDTMLTLAETLWSEPIHERRMAAVELLTLCRDLLEADDIRLIERLLRESRTWAYVDALAVNVAAALIQRFPPLDRVVDRWAHDQDFWIRRSCLLQFLPSLRTGGPGFERFARYADLMLEEREFFIRKAIGWVLREAGKSQPDQVYAWLAPRITRASGVTVREAVKYLAAPQQETLLHAYRQGATGGAAR